MTFEMIFNELIRPLSAIGALIGAGMVITSFVVLDVFPPGQQSFFKRWGKGNTKEGINVEKLANLMNADPELIILLVGFICFSVMIAGGNIMWESLILLHDYSPRSSVPPHPAYWPPEWHSLSTDMGHQAH